MCDCVVRGTIEVLGYAGRVTLHPEPTELTPIVTFHGADPVVRFPHRVHLPMVCHELAHIDAVADGSWDHGPNFRAHLTRLIGEIYGQAGADRLRAMFVEAGL